MPWINQIVTAEHDDDLKQAYGVPWNSEMLIRIYRDLEKLRSAFSDGRFLTEIY